MPVLWSGCWIWLGTTRAGYGLIRSGRAMVGAHRVAWQLYVGQIPTGMDVLHRCDIPACCNPGHLFIGTHADNMADKKAKGRNVNLSGERHGNAKLTWAQVEAIRSDDKSERILAQEYGVSSKTIHQVKHNRIWRL